MLKSNEFDINKKSIGLSLKLNHLDEILLDTPEVDFWEVITENLFQSNKSQLDKVEKLRQSKPINFHGVKLNIGSSDSLDLDYLKNLKYLIDRFEPQLVSDHLCWCGFKGFYSFDLLPFPKNNHTLKMVSEKLIQIQDFLKINLSLENISEYAHYEEDDYSIFDFFFELNKKTNCGWLLDLNNLNVNEINLKQKTSSVNFDTVKDFISQIHIAKFEMWDDVAVDTHCGVPSSDLISWALKISLENNIKNILFEWDRDMPSYKDYIYEYTKIKSELLK